MLNQKPRQLFTLLFCGFISSSTMIFGGFFGSSEGFDSPIKIAYDFSDIPSLEIMVAAENEGNSLNEIAIAD